MRTNRSYNDMADTLISEIEEHFDIEVDAAEMTPENFNSAAAMWKMIQRLQEN